jgi:hypothetical protein
MTKPEDIVTQKSQADLMAQVIELHNKIVDLRLNGRILSAEQNDLREYLQNISCHMSISRTQE